MGFRGVEKLVFSVALKAYFVKLVVLHLFLIELCCDMTLSIYF